MLKQAKRKLRRLLFPSLHRKEVEVPHVFLGSDYGGWPVLVETERGSLVYSFGVGEDISFDVAVIDMFGCEVHAFDPTPRSVEWVAKQSLPRGMHFHPIGLADQDGTEVFYAPTNPAHVSYTAAGVRNAGVGVAMNVDRVSCDVMRLARIVEQVGPRMPDIIKMDIEGMEYKVIENMVSDRILPRQFLVEFHHGKYDKKVGETLAAVASLRRVGYKIFFVSDSGREYGFVRT